MTKKMKMVIALAALARPAGAEMFDQLIDDLLHDEGGDKVTNRASDKGGLTKWGISKRAHPEVDVINLDRASAVAIYRAKYWDATRAGDLPVGLAKLVFDGAVNHGAASSIFMLQTAFNTLGLKDQLKLDGVIGDKTITAIADLDPAQVLDLITKYVAERMKRYGGDATWSANGLGWSNRLLGNLHQALMLAAVTQDGQDIG